MVAKLEVLVAVRNTFWLREKRVWWRVEIRNTVFVERARRVCGVSVCEVVSTRLR